MWKRTEMKVATYSTAFSCLSRTSVPAVSASASITGSKSSNGFWTNISRFLSIFSAVSLESSQASTPLPPPSGSSRSMKLPPVIDSPRPWTSDAASALPPFMFCSCSFSLASLSAATSTDAAISTSCWCCSCICW